MATAEKNNNGRATASESKATAPQNFTAPLPRLAYTMAETAKMCGVSYITIHRLLKRGKLRASGDIRNKVIPHTEVERWLRESTSQAA